MRGNTVKRFVRWVRKGIWYKCSPFTIIQRKKRSSPHTGYCKLPHKIFVVATFRPSRFSSCCFCPGCANYPPYLVCDIFTTCCLETVSTIDSSPKVHWNNNLITAQNPIDICSHSLAVEQWINVRHTHWLFFRSLAYKTGDGARLSHWWSILSPGSKKFHILTLEHKGLPWFHFWKVLLTMRFWFNREYCRSWSSVRDPVLSFVPIVAFSDTPGSPGVSLYVWNTPTMTVCGLLIGFNLHPAGVTLHIQCVQLYKSVAAHPYQQKCS